MNEDTTPIFRSSSGLKEKTTLWTNKIECILNSLPMVTTTPVQQNEVRQPKGGRPRRRESANGGYEEESDHSTQSRLIQKFIPPITTHNETHSTRPRFIPPTTYEDSVCASGRPTFTRSTLYSKWEDERGSVRSNKSKVIPPRTRDEETTKSKLQRPRRATIAINMDGGGAVGSAVFYSNDVEHSKNPSRPRHLRRRTTEYEMSPSKMAVKLGQHRSLEDAARSEKSVQMTGVKPCFPSKLEAEFAKNGKCPRHRRITIEGPCPFTALQMEKKRERVDSIVRDVLADLQQIRARDVSPELDKASRTPYSDEYLSVSKLKKSILSPRTESPFKEYKSPSPPRPPFNSSFPLPVPRRRCTLNDASLSRNENDRNCNSFGNKKETRRLNLGKSASPDTTNIIYSKWSAASLTKDKHSEKETETCVPKKIESISPANARTHTRAKKSRVSPGNDLKPPRRKLSSRRATCNIPESEGIAVLPFKRLQKNLSLRTSDSVSRSGFSRNQMKNGKTSKPRKNCRRVTDCGARPDAKTAHNLRRFHSPESFVCEEEEFDLSF